jgi:aldehyde dehydrogenase (NAD+)
MLDKRKFYINGEWVNPYKENDCEVINPCNEEPFADYFIRLKRRYRS